MAAGAYAAPLLCAGPAGLRPVEHSRSVQVSSGSQKDCLSSQQQAGILHHVLRRMPN